MIYEPFPAFVRTEHDPEGWLPSWNLYLEDNHSKEKLEELTILETDHIFALPESKWSILRVTRDTNLFAYFREHYWIVTDFKNYQTGHCPPEKKKKKKKYRSLFDE